VTCTEWHNREESCNLCSGRLTKVKRPDRRSADYVKVKSNQEVGVIYGIYNLVFAKKKKSQMHV